MHSLKPKISQRTTDFTQLLHRLSYYSHLQQSVLGIGGQLTYKPMFLKTGKHKTESSSGCNARRHCTV